MPLVNTIKNKNDRTSAERAAIEAYVPGSGPQSEATVLVRKAQRLDVDGVLDRSIPTPAAFAIKDLKPVVLR
jgi:hypothetical protein